MYPLTHLYFAQKVLGFLDDATVLGSVFPDMGVVIGLDWNRSHTLGQELWQHFQGEKKDLLNFSLGVLTHGIEPKGLDYYSHKKYRDFERGYCFEKARPLVNGVIEACYLPSGDGWWKAHNFVEMGIELYIYEKQPELLFLLQKALGNAALIRQLVSVLSPFLQKSDFSVQKVFATFRQFVAEEPFDVQLLALRYQRQVFFSHQITSIDLLKCQDIIQKGKKLVIMDIENFFEEVKELMLPIWKEIEICHEG